MQAVVYLLAVMALPALGAPQTGVISAVGSGKDPSEATLALLRAVVAKHYKDEPASLSRSLLQNEVLPNASSFVQSYKILEGGRGSSVAISANVDLDVVSALFSLSPQSLGEGDGAKALVVVKGARLPEGASTGKAGAAPANPYSVLESGARERMARRKFDVVSLSPEEAAIIGAGEDVAAPELLRGLGAKAGARIALGISSRYISIENENSHNREERIVVSATIVDVKASTVLGRSSISVPEPRSRRDQYASDLQKSLAEEGKDLFHESFVSAGKKLLKVPGREDFSVVRVQSPQSAILVSKFRTLLEASKGVQSVLEYSVQRGAFDLAVRPALKEAALAKAIQSLPSDEIAVLLLEPISQEEPGKAPALVVSLSKKEQPAQEGREVQSEEP